MTAEVKPDTILFTISSPEPVTVQQIDDVLCTAFEGGINYWCEIGRLNSGSKEEWKVDHSYEAISRGAAIKVYYHDGEALVSEVLNLKKLQDRGIPLTLAHYKTTWKEFVEDHDANMADVLVQYALFGEQTYS